MARDWTLSKADKIEIEKYRKDYRLFVAVQICSIRLYGRLLVETNDLSPRIINYLNSQLRLPPTLSIQAPGRKATYLDQRKSIMAYLGFRKFDDRSLNRLEDWLYNHALKGELPADLNHRAEAFLLSEKVIIPGTSTIERLVAGVCTSVHEKAFESVYSKLTPDLKNSIDQLLLVPPGEPRSYFHKLKEYPPSAKISSLREYIDRYNPTTILNVIPLENLVETCHTTKQPQKKEAGHVVSYAMRRIPLPGSQV